MQIKQEYTQSLEGGDFEDPRNSFCKVCFGQISAPLIPILWYHKGTRKEQDYYDHSPMPIEDSLLLLFLCYKHYGNGTRLKIGKYDDKKDLACKCYKHWYKLLKKEIEAGFYDDHYYDKNGITLCKKYFLELSSEPITNPDYPTKQGYLCEDCVKVLEQKKIIKIIPPSGKRKSYQYNLIEWVK